MGPGWGALMESLVSQGEGSTSVTEETQNTTDDSSSRDGSSSAQNSSCASENSTSPLKELFLLLKILPDQVSAPLSDHPRQGELTEVVMDLGRRPKAFFGNAQEKLGDAVVTRSHIDSVLDTLTTIGDDNRAGVDETLHRISCIRNREGIVIGLTLRIGKAICLPDEFLKKVFDGTRSILVLGEPGVGKTSVLREMARYLSTEREKRVLVIDTSNEIGGGGDTPHPAIGEARRMMLTSTSKQSEVMLEGVKNHTPEVLIIDEIGKKQEAISCQTIAQRGVQLISTAHGSNIEGLLNNPDLLSLVGGLQSVILSDVEARRRERTGDDFHKTVSERKGIPTFSTIIEIRDRNTWVIHDTVKSVDRIHRGEAAPVKVCTLTDAGTATASHASYNVGGKIVMGMKMHGL